jgi:hypothetical protein
VEWLKVQILSSNPSAAKKKKRSKDFKGWEGPGCWLLGNLDPNERLAVYPVAMRHPGIVAVLEKDL